MTDIPKFDKREVDAARIAFSGSVDDSEVILHVGDEVTQVVKGKVTGVGHKANQFGVLRRIHSIRIDHVMPADETTTERLAREIKQRADEEAGQESLDEQLDGETNE